MCHEESYIINERENTFLPLCHVLRHNQGTFNMYQGGILHPKEICYNTCRRENRSLLWGIPFASEFMFSLLTLVDNREKFRHQHT